MADEPNAGGETNPQAGQQQVIQVPIDVAEMKTFYANFFRVLGTPEELMIDFGLHTQQVTAQGADPVKLSSRLAISYFTAKRLMLALQRAVNLHEQSFGVLETDYRRRVRGGSPGAFQ